ncbi:hypothetical protein JXB28_06600 [Candidatus Woesearchaeota archaeon]|nr:hypothetical protein [Candidatus Woesearchaeota archaeon]
MNRLRKNKRAYLFTVDLVIAIIALIIGLALLFYKFSSVNKTIYFTEQISEDIIGVLAYTSTHDLCLNLDNTSTCTCPNYDELEQVVCGEYLQDKDTNLLSVMTELIETGAYSGDDVKAIINEIFVEKRVIDSRRFGFAILYTSLITAPDIPLELFNSERYIMP